MQRRIEVLVVTDYAYPSGGIELFVRELLGKLPERFATSVLSWSAGLPLPEGFTTVTTVEVGDVRAAWSGLDPRPGS